MENDLSGRRVFVTGASGFIGRRLVPALGRAGAEVTVLTRIRYAHDSMRRAARVLTGDLEDRALLADALVNQDVLFNLAYDVRASGAKNLAALENLLSAAESASVGRIVHISSIVVYDAWPAQDCDETGAMDRSGGGYYRQAKIEMERRLMAGRLPAAILQPTIVYGPGSSLWTDGFATALLDGGIVLPEPEGICNGVFVDDVVQACLRAAALDDLGRERFVISGPAPFKWSELLDGYARLLGRGDILRIPIADIEAKLGPAPPENEERSSPSAAARISAIARRLIGRARFERLVRSMRRRVSRGRPLFPSHHLLAEYTGRGICRIDQARTRLGYDPAYDLDKGLAATADHLARLAR